MAGCTRRYFRLAARDIARFQFVIEGHEGMATVSTVDNRAAVVMLYVAEGRGGDLDFVLEALRGEMGIEFREQPGWEERSRASVAEKAGRERCCSTRTPGC